MRRLITFILAAAAIVSISSCKKDPMLTVNPDSVTGKASGATSYVTVSSNYPWTASSSQPWIIVSPNSGVAGDTKVAVSMQSTSSTDPRSGSVTFTCESLTRTVSVAQDAKSTIETGSDTVVAEWNAKSVTVELQSNIEYNVIIPDDLTWIKESTTKGLASHKHTFSLEDNATKEQRSAPIVFSDKNSSLRIGVTVIQNGIPSTMVIEHSARSFIVPQFDGSGVTGSVDWGDGVVEAYQKALEHKYSSGKTHVVAITVAGAKSVTVDNLGDIESIDITAL